MKVAGCRRQKKCVWEQPWSEGAQNRSTWLEPKMPRMVEGGEAARDPVCPAS